MSEVADMVMMDLEEKMEKSESSMRNDLGAIRTGKASPSLVENMMIEYYGTQTRLRDMAQINAPEPRLLTIQPWDTSAVQAIEKAIKASNLGIMPNSDGRLIRLPIPELSEDRRKTLVKQVKSRSEEAKVAIRNARRDGNEAAKKLQKDGELTEDELKKLLDDIQKATDKHIADIDKIVGDKEKELLTI